MVLFPRKRAQLSKGLTDEKHSCEKCPVRAWGFYTASKQSESRAHSPLPIPRTLAQASYFRYFSHAKCAHQFPLATKRPRLNLGNQTMYFQNHHFLVPGPHRVRATSNSRDENGFWSKEMLTIFTSSRRIRLWILRIPSKISILPSHSSMSFTQRNTRTTRYRRLWLCSRVFSIKLPSVGSLITSKHGKRRTY